METQEIVLTGKVEKPEDYIKIDDKEYGERHFIREGEGYEEVTKPALNPVRVHADRNYQASEAGSFVKYVLGYGDREKGIIFFNDKGLTMFFNESSRVESVRLPLLSSLELRTFLGDMGNGRRFDQKAIVKAIETFPDVIDGGAIIRTYLEKLKLDTTIEFESDIDTRNHTFVYKEKTGSQTAEIPKQLRLYVPYFEGSANRVEVTVDLDIQRPKSADEKVSFSLTDPKAERTKRDALKLEIDTIQKALVGWMFVQGEPAR